MKRKFLLLCVVMAIPCWAWCGERLHRLFAQGFLRCGVAEQSPGFSQRKADGQFVGFEVDLCRALAGAMFGSPERARFVVLHQVHDFLARPEVDIVFHQLTWTLTREAPGQLEFGPVVLHDIPSADGLEPLAPLLHSDDADFARAVRWTFFALIEAEQRGITGDNVRANDWSPSTGPALGLHASWAADAVAAAGNYGEIFLRHFPQRWRGTNRLLRDGGAMFAPPVR